MKARDNARRFSSEPQKCVKRMTNMLLVLLHWTMKKKHDQETVHLCAMMAYWRFFLQATMIVYQSPLLSARWQFIDRFNRRPPIWIKIAFSRVLNARFDASDLCFYSNTSGNNLPTYSRVVYRSSRILAIFFFWLKIISQRIYWKYGFATTDSRDSVKQWNWKRTLEIIIQDI